MSKPVPPKKQAYNKAYKNERRIVTYVDDPKTKSILVERAAKEDKSLSELTGPALKELADGTVKKRT